MSKMCSPHGKWVESVSAALRCQQSQFLPGMRKGLHVQWIIVVVMTVVVAVLLFVAVVTVVFEILCSLHWPGTHM